MSDSKELGFSIVISGVSNEATEIAKLTVQLKNLKQERNELIKQASSPGHIASKEELQKLAAYNKEIGVQDAALKTLKRTVDSASDSLARKKAVLIELTEKSNKASASIAQEMAPAINKLNQEVKNGEEARGVFTRNVGNYPQLFNAIPGPVGNAARSIEGFATKLGSVGPVGAIIAGGILALSAPLVGFFKWTQEGMDLIAVKTSEFNAQVRVLKGELSNLGKNMVEGVEKSGLSKFLTNIWSGFKIQTFGVQAATEMKVASDAAKVYTESIHKIEEAEIAEIVPREKATEQIRAARLAYQEGNGTIAEKLKLFDDALTLENKTTAEEIKNARDRAKALNDYYTIRALSIPLTRAEKKELEEAKAKESELMAASESRLIKFAGLRKKLQKEAIAGESDLTDAEKKAAKDSEEELNKQIKLKQAIALDEEPDLVKRAQLQAAFDRDNLLRATKNADEQKLIWEKYYADVEKIAEDSTKKRLDKEWEEGVKAGKKLYDETQKEAQDNWNASLRAEKIRAETEDMVLKDRLARGKISNKAYLKDKMEDDIAYAQKTITNQEELGARIAQIQKKYEIDERNRKIKLQRDISNAVLAGAQSGADAIFNARKDQLNAAMNAELTNTNLTEAQKAEIKKKYARLQQQQDIKQAIVNGAIAITKTFADYGFTPAAWIAGALMAVQTAIQIAVIKAQKFVAGGFIKKVLQGSSNASKDNALVIDVSNAELEKIETGKTQPGKIKGGLSVNTGTKDDKLILANETETILTEEHVKKLGGPAVMKKIGVPGYEEGGKISAADAVSIMNILGNQKEVQNSTTNKENTTIITNNNEIVPVQPDKQKTVESKSIEKLKTLVNSAKNIDESKTNKDISVNTINQNENQITINKPETTIHNQKTIFTAEQAAKLGASDIVNIVNNVVNKDSDYFKNQVEEIRNSTNDVINTDIHSPVVNTKQVDNKTIVNKNETSQTQKIIQRLIINDILRNIGFPVIPNSKDNKLIFANDTETVLTQKQVERLGGSRAMALAGVPGYQNVSSVNRRAPQIHPALMGSGILNRIPHYESGGFLGAGQPPVIQSGSFNMIEFEKIITAMNSKADSIYAMAESNKDRIDRLQVIQNVNELNKAQNEVRVVQNTNRI